MYRILLIAIALIVYGSLFPWQYNPAHGPGNPILQLIHSWPRHVRDASVGDVIVNLLLYIPVGMFGYLAMQRFRFIGPVVLGFVLSSLIEIAQFYDVSRDSSPLDVACNTIGSGLGVLLGIVFSESLMASLHNRGLTRGLHPSGPLVLLFVWVGYLILPVFPLTMHIRMKVQALLHADFSALELVTNCVLWLIVARLLAAIYPTATAWKILLLLSLLAPAKILIAYRTTTVAELAGVVAALVLWLPLSYWKRRTLSLAVLTILIIILRGMSPFHFTSGAAPFRWIPFVSLIDSERESSLIMLCYKSFTYGAAIWLLWSVRRNLVAVVSVVAAILTAIEIAQTHLPGHVAETTDPLLAIIFGSVFWFLETRQKQPAASQKEFASQ